MGLDRLAARPAALMKWVHDNLSNGRKYEVIGNGGGAAATYIAQYWIDPDGTDRDYSRSLPIM